MLDSLLRRDRFLILAGLLTIALIAWLYLVNLTQQMRPMDSSMDMGMAAAIPQVQPWQLHDFTLTFLMWAVMMVAMMLPAAAPMILTFAALKRQKTASSSLVGPVGAFVLGYLLVWLGFSLLATLVQGLLHEAALLTPMMSMTSSLAASGFLIAAGLFQWTPLKHRCLHHCRTPFSFLLNEWRSGRWGALIMGLRHGRYCLGCCWLLMGLLFVAGVMNLLWVAVLAGIVLVEKVTPAGHYVSRVVGVGLLLWGIWLAAGAVS